MARDYAASSSTQQASNFSQIVTTFGNICLAIFFAFAPIAIAYAAFAGPPGIGILMKFVMFGAWTQTFLPMAAILNYAMYSNLDSFSYQVFIANQGAMGTGTVDVLYDHAVRVHTVLAEMVGYIPLIALAIITGSMHAWTHVARGMGQTMDTVTKDNAARDVGGMGGTAALAGMLPGTSSRMTYHAASSFTAEGLARGGTFAQEDRHINQAKVSAGSIMNNQLATKRAKAQEYGQQAQRALDAAVDREYGTGNVHTDYQAAGKGWRDDKSEVGSTVRKVVDSVGKKVSLTDQQKEEFAGRLQASIGAGVDLGAAIATGVGAVVGFAAGGPPGAVLGALSGEKLAEKTGLAGKGGVGGIKADAGLTSTHVGAASQTQSNTLDKASVDEIARQHGDEWRVTQSNFRESGTKDEYSRTNRISKRLQEKDHIAISNANKAAKEVAATETAIQSLGGNLEQYTGDLAKQLYANPAVRQQIEARMANDGTFRKGASMQAERLVDYSYTGNPPDSVNFRDFAGAVQYMALTGPEQAYLGNLMQTAVGVGGDLTAPEGNREGVTKDVDGQLVRGQAVTKRAEERTSEKDPKDLPGGEVKPSFKVDTPPPSAPTRHQPPVGHGQLGSNTKTPEVTAAERAESDERLKTNRIEALNKAEDLERSVRGPK